MTLVARRQLSRDEIVEWIETILIHPTESSVRRDNGSVSDLVDSVRQHGLLQPLIVRPDGAMLKLVCGQRRLTACKILRWKTIPCIVREIGEKEAFEMSLAENLQRKTLNPIEEAVAFKQYVQLAGWGSVHELAEKIGKSPEYVSHRISLLRLPEQILHDVEVGKIPVSSAYELLGIGSDEVRLQFSKGISESKLSSKMVRRAVKTLRQNEMSDSLGVNFFKDPCRESDESCNSLNAAVLVYKVTLARLDKIINDCKDDCIQKQLLAQRYHVHSLIDDCIKIKRSNQNSHLG
ncbi:MAG: ParB/RepB/Spo0J family partition protein [Nitrososphaerota archaeon]|nr:ParB/RepB/Spo0J family partition protein [Nitrososphaerota archaeon]